MMGSCAFLMPVGSLKFISEKAYSLRAALGLTIGGIPGVLLAAYIVKSLDLKTVRWLVIVVVVYTAVTMLTAGFSADGRRSGERRPSVDGLDHTAVAGGVAVDPTGTCAPSSRAGRGRSVAWRDAERAAAPRSRKTRPAIPRGDFRPCDPRRRLKYHRRISAPGTCRPHASVVAAASGRVRAGSGFRGTRSGVRPTELPRGPRASAARSARRGHAPRSRRAGLRLAPHFRPRGLKQPLRGGR